MIATEKYRGDEGSLDSPAFPLQYNHCSGAISVCHNEDDLIKAREYEHDLDKAGFIMAVTFFVIVAIVGLALWGLFLAAPHISQWLEPMVVWLLGPEPGQ